MLWTLLALTNGSGGGLSDRALVAVSTIIASIIGALVAYATQRSAARAAVHNQTVQSRTDIEREAFERAKGFYTDTIDRQGAEIHELEGDVAGLKTRVAEQDVEIANLRAELDTAKRALALRYPDET